MKKALTLGLIFIGASAMAQTPPANPNVVVVSAGKSIAQAAADWGAAANATVVVDPSLTGRVSAATAKLSLEAGLAAVAKAEKAQWQKAYLKPADIPKGADGKVDFLKLRSIVESASAVSSVSVGVLDPSTDTISMSTRVKANEPSTQEWLKGRQVIYVLYRPTITDSSAGRAGADPVNDYLTTQRNTMEAFRNMTPEQRAEASRQGLRMMMDMDPDAMMQMARESMHALQQMTPEEKARMMDMSMRIMVRGMPGQ